MQLNELKRDNPNKDKKRVGRGRSRGKTSGKGMKGQKARTGNSTRPALRDIIKKLPKLRGQGINGNKNKSIINKYTPINLAELENSFSDGDVVNQKTLREKNLSVVRNGKEIRSKILGNGDVSKKLTIEGLLISKTAQEKIEKAGGKIN